MLNNNDPNELYEGTSWELVAQDRCIQGASDTHTVGTTIESGLPNVTGQIGGNTTLPPSEIGNTRGPKAEGPFQQSVTAGAIGPMDNDTWNIYKNTFDLSLANPIYGASEVVQPPSIYMNIWKRTS